MPLIMVVVVVMVESGGERKAIRELTGKGIKESVLFLYAIV